MDGFDDCGFDYTGKYFGVLRRGKFGVLWLGTALGVAVLRIERLVLAEKTACDRATSCFALVFWIERR